VAWIQVLRGDLKINGEGLHAGDGAAVIDERRLTLGTAGGAAEVLVFDLA